MRRDPKKAVAVLLVHVAGLKKSSHDFPFGVYRIDFGLLGIAARIGHVDRHEDAIVQDKAMMDIVENVQSYNRPRVVNSLSDCYVRAGHVKCCENAFAASQEAVEMCGVALIPIISHDLTDVVDPDGHCPKQRVVPRNVERGEGALMPDVTMTYIDCIPVDSHDLALRIDEAA